MALVSPPGRLRPPRAGQVSRGASGVSPPRVRSVRGLARHHPDVLPNIMNPVTSWPRSARRRPPLGSRALVLPRRAAAHPLVGSDADIGPATSPRQPPDIFPAPRSCSRDGPQLPRDGLIDALDPSSQRNAIAPNPCARTSGLSLLVAPSLFAQNADLRSRRSTSAPTRSPRTDSVSSSNCAGSTTVPPPARNVVVMVTG